VFDAARLGRKRDESRILVGRLEELLDMPFRNFYDRLLRCLGAGKTEARKRGLNFRLGVQ
jgi:hypothetical protein